MRQVTARCEAEAHDRIAGLTEREVDGEVGGAARVGLHVHVEVVLPFALAPRLCKERLDARDRELLDLVDDLLSLVVALARVALGIFVRQARSGGFHDRARGVVFARDEPQRLVLAAVFVVDEGGDGGVGGAEIGLEHGGGYYTMLASLAGARTVCRLARAPEFR